MKKEEIEPKLASLMDTVPECEGLIAADANGKVIVGQTITELDHGKIAKEIVTILNSAAALGKLLKKGATVDTTMEFNDGFAQVTVGTEGILIGIMGLDGRNSMSLLMRNMKSILK